MNLSFYKKKKVFNDLPSFIDWFFKLEAHSWLKFYPLARAHLTDFFETIPFSMLEALYSKNHIIFVPSSGKFSCTFSTKNQVIIVFPELLNMLSSLNSSYAFGIIAHELGHIYYEHSKKRTDGLTSQVEADRFACELGLAGEVSSFLEDYAPESLEKRVRLTYLTSYLLKNA